ncbi:MAG: hypothetical protein IKJ48_01625 [Alistipes sp.]|nr:hypothetical protein [Alistipes sp.]
MARYILEFLFCSGLFIALYKLLIEERVAHSWARVYLVAGMLLSAVIPMLELPIYPAQTLYYELPLLTFTEELPESTSAAMAEPKAPAIDWTRVLSMVAWGVYLIVCGLNIARFVYRLWVIRRLRTVAKLTVYEAYTLAESERVKEPFSFWRTIFMNYMFSGREREQILIHERSHVLHRHTAERLTLELLRCVFWFNPFVWLAANALVEVQEWEADSDVLNQGYDVYEYRQLIFRQLFGYNADITCGLNSQLTKKRFLMMTNFKRGKLSFIRLGVAIPMVVAMILAFGAVRAEADDSTEPITPTLVEQNLPDEEKSTVYISADGTIRFNGEVVTMDELKVEVAKVREELGVEAMLTIKADEDTRVGKINDVKQIAREAKMLRIRYYMPRGAINSILPPPASSNEKVVEVVDHIAHHNLLNIFVNARARIMTGRPDGTSALVDLAELKSIVKAFIDNSESVAGKRQVKNKNYSDFTWQTIKRGDGEVHYPVSNGVLYLVTTRDLPADEYWKIQSTIHEAYAELRDELAQSSFHKPFSALEGDDRNYILQAIPMRVSEADPRLPAEASK